MTGVFGRGAQLLRVEAASGIGERRLELVGDPRLQAAGCRRDHPDVCVTDLSVGERGLGRRQLNESARHRDLLAGGARCEIATISQPGIG
jgi:hypothetical protein